jgi:cellulose synthase/poly-beta-1,6-N-acetylglucosamine synthase-like glycosyltransferase
VFAPDYFRIYRRKLSRDYVVAIGFVQSLRGNWISTYRAFSYTYGQQVYRRIQSFLGMVSVFPGPVTSFRTDILAQLKIDNDNVTEDFDITLQVHRKNLGKILYIPKAVNYTQDPQSFSDFCKQSSRWYTGFFQGIQEYHIGLGRQRIDIGIGLQLLQTIFFLIQAFILFPIVMITTHHWLAIPLAVTVDFILTSALTIASAVAIRRWMLLGVLPYFYFLRVTELILYFSAMFKVVLRRHKKASRGWATEGRR